MISVPTVLVPFMVFLIGQRLICSDAYKSKKILFLPTLNTIFCALNSLQKFCRAIGGAEISRVERVAFIFAALMWISAMFLHVYISIKGIKYWKNIRKRGKSVDL